MTIRSKTAIVILNWNGKILLEKFLPILIENTAANDCNIFVIDNASTDDSCSFLASHYPTINIIELDKNYGFAGGYDKGLKFVDYEYYILLNSDVEVTSGWITPLIDFLDNNKDVAVVQPKIRSQRNKEYFEYAGACGGFIDKMGFPFCRGRIFDTLEQDNKQYDTIRDIFWASGACFVIRSAEFWKHFGFDENFFAHMEEIDLCWRIWLSGSRIVCVPESVVYHVGGGTLNEESPFKTYLNYRNNMLMLYKNLDNSLLKAIISKRRIYNFIAAFKFIISGKMKLAQAIFKADKDFRRQKENYNEYRNNKENTTRHLYGHVIYENNLVYKYFIKKKKTFEKLNF